VSTVALSVVVPTRGRPAALRRCLDALAACEAPPGGAEVVVVADGPQPAVAPVLAQVEGLDLRHVEVQPVGPAGARNRGVDQARGAVVAFTDDDCTPTRGWMRALVDGLQSSPGAVAGGPVLSGLPGNRRLEAAQLIVDVVHSELVAGDRPAAFFSSNNLAMARADYIALGGFDEAFGMAAAEDRDLCDRARAAGHPLRMLPGAVVLHHHDLTLLGLWRQQYRYGRGAVVLHRARTRRGMPRLVADRGFHRALAAAAVRAGPRRAALVALTQVAYLTGIATEWRAPHRRRPLAG
jgi:GT2 family glycosyltransferase